MLKRETFENAASLLKHSAYPVRVEATVDIDGKPELFTAFSTGLTKRELFAAMAMQGILANAETHSVDAAADAVALADELIAELDKAGK